MGRGGTYFTSNIGVRGVAHIILYHFVYLRPGSATRYVSHVQYPDPDDGYFGMDQVRNRTGSLEFNYYPADLMHIYELAIFQV